MMKPNAHLRLSGRQWQLTKRVPGTKRRLIINLHTSDLLEARRKRDDILHQLHEELRPKSNDETAMALRSQGDESSEEAAGVWAEGLEPTVGLDEAVRLYKVATGHATPTLLYLETFQQERPSSHSTMIARKTAISRLPYKTIEAVTLKEAGLYVSKLAASGLNSVTVNNRVSMLRTYWQFLVAKGLAKSNPWIGQTVRRDKRSKGRRGSGVWSYGELSRMLTETEPMELRAFIEALAYSGCRIGELCELQVRSVGNGGFKIEQGKTVNAERQVHLPKRIMAGISKRCSGLKPTDFVFCRDVNVESLGDRGRISAITKRVSRSLVKVFPEHQVEGQRTAVKTAHGLRKLFTTIAEQEGCPPHIIDIAIGHAREKLSLSVYSAGPSQIQVADVFSKVGLRLDDELVR